MKTIIITRGLPGSGKTTWACKKLKELGDGWIRINKDVLRELAFGVSYKYEAVSEHFVREMQEHLLRLSLRRGKNVIIDNTHTKPQSIEDVCQIAQEVGDVTVKIVTFDVPVEQCVARDAARAERTVGDDVIRQMHAEYGPATVESLPFTERYFPWNEIVVAVQDASLPEAMIFDLDGTAALMGDRSPFDASRCDELDEPNVAVIQTAIALHVTRGAKIIFITGRKECDRAPTVRFIEKHLRTSRPLEYELHMRPDDDQRKDEILKREIYDRELRGKFYVMFIVEDRPRVVRMWRELGLLVYQVNDVEF